MPSMASPKCEKLIGGFFIKETHNMSGVKIRVRADAAQAQREIGKLEKSVVSLDKRAQATSKAFKNLALGITAVFTGGALTKGLTRNADAMTNFSNRVNLVTRDMKQTKIVMDELFKIAARSRGDVDAAAETFNRFGLALQDAGKPVSELLKVTEAVQKAAVISGAGAQSAKAAIVQLGQGLASGQLRGQELNSVLEQMPRLAQAIATGMGIPFGELREQAMKGKVTAEAVYQAILNGAYEIDQEYNTLTATVSGLATVFGNEWTRAIGELDKAVGSSAGIKDGLELATIAVRAFGQNIGFMAGIVNADLLLIDQAIRQFAFDAKNVLKGLFSGDITSEDAANAIIDTFNNAKEKIKGGTKIAIEFTVKKMDLIKTMLPSMEEAKIKVFKFTQFIKNLFKRLHHAVVGNSYWTSMFDPSKKKSGQKLAIGSDLSAYLAGPKAQLTAWGASIQQIFSDLHFEAYDSWQQLITSVNEIGLRPYVDMKFESAWTASIGRISSTYDTLRAKLLEKTTINPDIVPDSAKIGETTATLKNNIKLKFDEESQKALDLLGTLGAIIQGTLAFTTGKIVFESVIKSGGATQEFIKTLAKDLEDNKELIGTALSLGIALGFKYGFAKVIGGGLILFNGKEIINDPKFQNSLGDFGQGLGELLDGIFNQEGGDAGESFIKGLSDSIQALGEGVLQGLFGQGNVVQVGDILSDATVQEGSIDFSGFAKAFTGGLTAAIGGAVVSKTIRKALFSAVKIAFVGLGSLTLGLVAAAFGAAFFVEHWDIDTKLSKSADDLGTKMLTYFGIESKFAKDFTAGFTNTIGVMIRSVLLPFRNLGLLVKAAMDDSYSMKDALSDMKDNTIELYSDIAEIFIAPFREAFEFIKQGFIDIKNSAKDFIFGDGKGSADGFDPNDPKYNNYQFPLKRANGGPVNGPGTGTSDDIPAMLSNGEFVMQQSSVQKFGPAFMAAINQGIMPEFRKDGDGIGDSFFGKRIKKRSSRLSTAYDNAIDRRDVESGLKIIEQLKQLNDLTEEQVKMLESGTKGAAEGLKGDDKDVAALKTAEAYAENFKQAFASGLSELLHGGDLKDVLGGLLDNFTSSVIDSFASSFTESAFENLTPMLTDLFKGIGSMGGGAGGGFDIGGAIMKGIGFFSGGGMAQGGTVPSTSYSQAGKDSVPAMLMPGEMVLSKNAVRNMGSQNNSSQQSFNINVQGDVSRQTRKEIVKMMPQIAGGVNATNKENNKR